MRSGSILKRLSDAVSPLVSNRHIAIAAVVTSLLLVTVPFEVALIPLAREFRLDNPHINYEYSSEHVPVPLLALLVLILPIAAILLPAAFNQRYRRHSILSVLAFLLGITATMFISDFLKWAIGNQRPDFIARCQPKPGVTHNELVTVEAVCTNPDMAMVWEGCRSTPSGHSSLSFAGLGFLTIWIFFTFDMAHKSRPLYAKALTVIPLIVAGAIAFTRIIDHKHHWIDIISGGLIGFVVAYFVYVYAVADSKPEKPEREHAIA